MPDASSHNFIETAGPLADSPFAEDLRLAIDAARAGGALAAAHIDRRIKTWDKAKGDPVTEIDLAVNALLEERLRGARPSYGWLSEETKDDKSRLRAERTWVIDPIDGTRAYIKGKPEYCVSVACVEQGRPVLGVLYDPSAQATYVAAKGSGAWTEQGRMRVSSWSNALTSKLILAPDMAEHRLWPQKWSPRALVRPNSMALRIAWVARGDYDLTLALSQKRDWDTAAADLLLSEAGGRLTDHENCPYVYNQSDTAHPFLIASTPGVHEKACAQVRGLIEAYRSEQASKTT